MNKVLLVGRLTKDPTTRTAQSGKEVARFQIAVSRAKKGEADFIPCVAFDVVANFVQKYFQQGSWIAVEGRWQSGSYEDSDGKRHYTNDCVVERAGFAGAKPKEEKPEQEQYAEPVEDEGLPF